MADIYDDYHHLVEEVKRLRRVAAAAGMLINVAKKETSNEAEFDKVLQELMTAIAALRV